MKITHPIAGYNGYVSGPRNFGLHFLAGVAHAKAHQIPAAARRSFEDDGFTFTDERRQPAQDAPESASDGEQPGT